MAVVFVHAIDGGEAGKVELSVRVLRTTDKGVLVDAGRFGELWLPRRAVEIRQQPGGTVALLPRWLAHEKGIVAWTQQRKTSRRRCAPGSTRRKRTG